MTTPTLTATLCLTCLASHPLRQCSCFWWLLVSLSCPCYHRTLPTSLPNLLNQIMATYTETTMIRAIRVVGKCYSALSAQPISGLSPFTSEFIGRLDDVFSRSLIIKYSHQADAPLQNLKDKFNNSKRNEQRLTLVQNAWWDKLWVCMQSYIFIRCSIFKEGSDLNIEIYKESQRKKIMTFGSASEGDLLCRVIIKFNDLWKHLVAESQKETKCKLIVVSIASDGLRIPQRTSRQNLLLQSQDCSSGLSLRYDHF